jgi:hypothetical protein
VGVRFTVGHVGVLSQVKYYIEDLNVDSMVGFLKFQGS